MKNIRVLLPYLIFPIFTLIFTNCGNFSSEQLALWDKVMEVHDESMINHGTMMSLGQQVRKFKDNEALPPALKYVVKPTMDQIEKADEDMMQWMNDLKGKFKVRGMESEAITKYWKEELAKIEEIDKQIIASTKAATEFLAQAKKY